MTTRAAGASVAVWSVLVMSLPADVARGYENFKVSVYSRAYETREMNDVSWIEPRWTELTRQVHVDKIYLETHRDLIIVDEATLKAAKKFFADRGVQTAGGMMYLDRYAEQLWLTLFAKAPEITLFDIRQVQRPLAQSSNVAWRGQQTSFDFDEMIKPVKLADGTIVPATTIARAAGYTFEKVDKVLGKLGQPIGVKSYKPYHSTGEDYLHTYLGMCGIPMDLVPQFPAAEKMILLMECAKFDPAIVEKIKGQLMAGKSVVITSGLLRALQGKGIEDIAGLRYTDRKAVVKEFGGGFGGRMQAKAEMVIPQLQYLTNDAWEELSAMDGTNGWPMLISAVYAKGTLYVLTIPESFTDLYDLPAGVLSRIKDTLTRELPVRVDGPGRVSLFVYDNDTFIVESFLDEPVDVGVTVAKQATGLHDVLSGEVLSPARGGAGGPRMPGFGGRGPNAGPRTTFNLQIKPHSYRVFRCQ